MSESGDYDPTADSFLSWQEWIAELRRRFLAGEPIPEIFQPRVQRAETERS